MKKFLLSTLFTFGFSSLAVFAINVEFNTVNPNYLNNGFIQNTSVYQKKQNVLLQDNVFSSPALKSIVNEEKDTKKEERNINNYSVFSPEEYKPANFDKEAVLFIIDFSGSMTEKINGKEKIDMAIDTMYNILPQLSPNAQLGLRLYGHKNSITPIDACRASDLIVPIEPNNASRIYSELTKAKAKGNTPITYSLKQAVEKDFANFTGKKRIILLTDGGENCDESPCTYATNILTQRPDISIDVIAFDVNNPEADAQLKCTALVTSGKFYKANSESQLVESLKNSLNIHKDVQGVILKDLK
ncbi:VWA domain-containing protein [bacterium]|nr:VWA domain-containing protein [bacterium]